MRNDFFEEFLIVKKSKIPSAGKGVFTTINIKKEHIITEFTGEKVSHTIGAARFILKKSHSILYLNKKYSLDSLSDPSCIATYINDAKGLIRVPYLRNNSKLVSVKGRLFVIALKNIRKGDEILMAYGNNYWKAIKEYKIL